MTPAPAGSPVSPDAIEGDEVDEGDVDVDNGSDVVTTGTEAIDQTEEVAEVRAAIPDPAPERVTPLESEKVESGEVESKLESEERD